MSYSEKFDVIVVGGGHAGCEAALASARMGRSTLLLTHNIETLGQMSCNPAIGGIGKTHLVREIDALGGAMALVTDKAGIHFRVLNSSKGPAVRATRAQADRSLYKRFTRYFMENQPNLTLFQQAVDDLIVEGDQVLGVITQIGLKYFSHSIVITAGTFLSGKIHVGLENYSGGRAGDPPSIALASRLRELPLGAARLKTGTPPRIDGKTVDFSVMKAQSGDFPSPVMSYLGKASDHPEQVNCYITRTTLETHEIIRANLDKSPMYTGIIEGVGPRYCPSIEDKVVRFSDKDSHQIFIEPEGLDTNELYPNGISTSLPYDVQVKIVRSLPGFERARITRPGYAIEYDYFDPRGLSLTLESKHIEGLFFAGQVNGTTGYEEAAAQGLLAGVNAALKAAGADAWYPRRDQAYIGVLVDDLVRFGASEPYRMFTSRAEHRLILREDNADRRLTEIGRKLGLVSDDRWRQFNQKLEAIEKEKALLKNTWVRMDSDYAKKLIDNAVPINKDATFFELLKRPEVNFNLINSILGVDSYEKEILDQIEIDIKYEGYIVRQLAEVEKLKKMESTVFPENIDFSNVSGLSNEVRQKLHLHQPKTLGQASRVPGVTPAAVSLLFIYLKKKSLVNESISFSS